MGGARGSRGPRVLREQVSYVERLGVPRSSDNAQTSMSVHIWSTVGDRWPPARTTYRHFLRKLAAFQKIDAATVVVLELLRFKCVR